MYREFDNEPSHAYRALQVWQILIAKAANRQITTYGELGEIIGFGGAGVFAQILGHIMYYCQKNKLPALTALVVRRDKGLPGTGLEIPDPDSERQKVFEFHWFRLIPPTPVDLKDAYAWGQSQHP